MHLGGIVFPPLGSAAKLQAESGELDLTRVVFFKQTEHPYPREAKEVATMAIAFKMSRKEMKT